MPFTSRRPEGARPPPPPPLRGGGGSPPGPGGRWGEVAVPRGQGWHPAECPLPPPLPPPRGWAALARAPRSRGAVSGTAPAAAGNGGTPQGQRGAPQVWDGGTGFAPFDCQGVTQNAHSLHALQAAHLGPWQCEARESQ